MILTLSKLERSTVGHAEHVLRWSRQLTGATCLPHILTGATCLPQTILTLSFPWGGAQSELDCKLHNKSAAEEEAMKQALSELS